MTTGAVQCWGRNAEGQLGNSSDQDAFPVPVRDLSEVAQLALGRHSCALNDQGKSVAGATMVTDSWVKARFLPLGAVDSDRAVGTIVTDGQSLSPHSRPSRGLQPALVTRVRSEPTVRSGAGVIIDGGNWGMEPQMGISVSHRTESPQAVDQGRSR